MAHKKVFHGIEQPPPFTPGLSSGEVRDHAFRMFQLKLAKGELLTLEDWVNAEKDLNKDRDLAAA